ncbi:hypothetical protein C3747_1g778 [Trypanosoma cruzi]|uniref:BTB domain-containing protein n=2 Tax=Trypanosoma cruzi TaxID=5693 RepID=A0A2V2XPR0_TRYCR|nr:putative btb/poz domain containing protein [Trypanosoma cruzi]PWV21903.1 hypothetical protein C3747_1g778 [Trypanosoma cruzi]RNC62101.1 hypothetical protein TcCL_ESM00116 [Trypanosoma cruzi]
MPQRSTVTRERHKRPRHGGEEIRKVSATPHRSDMITDESVSRNDEIDESQESNCLPSAISAAAEAADIQNELKRQFDACQLIERDVASLLKQRELSTVGMGSILSLRNISPYDVIRLNVGDETFTVPLQLLLGKDGQENYFDVLLGFRSSGTSRDNDDEEEEADKNRQSQVVQPPLLDETGALFIDRDPATFRLILNYLRGYRMLTMLNEDQLSMLKTDARYFQIRGLMDELGDQTPESAVKFRPGPGVNPERNRFRVIYGVAMVGNRFLITGRHRITFQVLNSDYVGIGLVSDSCVSTDQEFHRTSHCCVYYMTGVFYSNFPHHRKEDGLEALEKDDYVSLMVDMNRRVAEYTLKNSAKMISLGNARKLRFAVAMKLSSSVRIVPEEEARQLPLFQRKAQTDALLPGNRTPTMGDDREALTQVSQSNGAGLSAPGRMQEQVLLQRPQSATSLFVSRSLDGGSRPGFTDGLGRTARAIVLSSFTSGSLPSDINEIDPLLFIPGNREARDDT